MGMSDSIGPLKYGEESQEVFLGKDYNEKRNTSDHVSEIIDSEVSVFIKNAENNAISLINENISKLHDLASALLDNETIDSKEFIDIINNGYEKIDIEDTDDETPDQNNDHDSSPSKED